MRQDSLHFPATRAAALSRWQAFLLQVPQYARRRNYVVEGHPYVSCLSPAIRCRLITEEEILRTLSPCFPFSQVEKFVQELLWRGYWKAWLEGRPGVWRAYITYLESARDTLSANQRERMDAVLRADSGIAVMDAFTRELLETGYLHNHARMWWASYWIHVEKLPWQLGANFFYQHLLDADPASNTLSWRWVAGLQTRGKVYPVLRSNIEKYLSPALRDPRGLERLDDHRFQAAQVTEGDDESFTPVRSAPGPGTFGGTRWGLWLHEEDLNPEGLGLSETSPVSIRGVTSSNGSVVSCPSRLRKHYIRACLQDGIMRAGEKWNLGPERCALVDAPSLPAHLLQWAEHEQLEVVVCSRPAVGPLRDQLPVVEGLLKKQGVRLVSITRPWDDRLYAFAKGGFFPFWEKTKPLVRW